MDFDGFMALIRKDNARYAEALALFAQIADVTCDRAAELEREARRTQSDVGAPDGCTAPASGTE